MHPSAQQLLLVIAGALTVEVEAQGKTLLEAGEAVIIPADLVPTFADE
jgi:quercetin dioxygenase-like cupin family protein